jgi:3-phenylpropionate/trans-cinnamate dioxygenase ferredoxin component
MDAASTWHRVAAESELTDDQPLAVQAGSARIGLFRVNGQVHAVENVCPHAFALLSDGFVDGCTVECPLHNAVFDLSTGKLLDGPGQRDLRVFQVKREDGAIYVAA